MEVYISHPSNIPYRTEVYQPIRNSPLNEAHTITLPHEDSTDQFDSKKYFQNDCKLVVAITSFPSTGVGIELGWANAFELPIVCLHKAGTQPSGSLSEVTETIEPYKNTDELLQLLSNFIQEHE